MQLIPSRIIYNFVSLIQPVTAKIVANVILQLLFANARKDIMVTHVEIL